jgi:uncharacterized membrane protein
MLAAVKVPSALERLLIVAVIGIVTGVAVAFVAPWQLAVLAGWDAMAATFVAWVWIGVARFTPEATRVHATQEDTNRVSASVLLLSASVVSLVGTALALTKANNAHSGGRAVLLGCSVLTIALSWAVVHTVFALRYAHEYYTDPVGGIDFKSEESPDYLDFAYVAFTVGMTFQVSDTDVQARRIRRTVIRHALLAYLFGAVILAVAVSVIAGLANK